MTETAQQTAQEPTQEPAQAMQRALATLRELRDKAPADSALAADCALGELVYVAMAALRRDLERIESLIAHVDAGAKQGARARGRAPASADHLPYDSPLYDDGQPLRDGP